MRICDFCEAKAKDVAIYRVEYLLRYSDDPPGIIDTDGAELCRPCFEAMRDRIRNVIKPEGEA